MKTRIQKAGKLVSSTEWTLDKQLKAKDLHPMVVKFCAGLSVYSLKKTNGKESENILLQVVYVVYREMV